jgi:hypothetical protein
MKLGILFSCRKRAAHGPYTVEELAQPINRLEDTTLMARMAPHTATVMTPGGQPLRLSSGSRLCLFNEPSGVTLALIQAVQK